MPGSIEAMSAPTRPRTAPPSTATPPPWLAGQQWSQLRLRQPGWLILPLRAFLAVTFIYAGSQKLANPTYLSPANPASVVGQMHTLRHVSPIGPLLGLSLHAPTLVGLLIAFGELAVGVGVLLGLWTRLAALGGMALALTFLLTVSWTTSPYYYGSDIVFFFAWSVIVAFGAGNVLSMDGWLHHRARTAAGVQPLPAVVSLEVPRLREICGRADACGLRPAGTCTRGSCGVFPAAERVKPSTAADLDRRRVLLGTRTVLIVGGATLATGGLVAWIGRLAGGTARAGPTALGTSGRQGPSVRTKPNAAHKSTAANAPRDASPTPNASAPGTAIGRASQVPVGQAGRFTDPKSGQPAWVVHPGGTTFVAFSAVCTHAGCVVQFDSNSMQFVCPCHGGTYDARSGRVLAGPPPSPLPGIPVHVVNGEIRVD